jgi:hypothetical protein
VCRCGAERSRLEALGLKVSISPDTDVPDAPTRTSSGAHPTLPGLLLGYRHSGDISLASRIVFTLLFLILVGGMGYGLVAYTHLPLAATRENVEIVATLEGHTKSAGHGGNAIPTFVTLPGTIAVLEPTMTKTDLLKPLNETELEGGFCSASVAQQIRHQFPGFYEDWPDAKLERVAIEKYPEFQDRLCVIASQLGASPDDVVMYRLRPRTMTEATMLWSRTALITGLFAIALLNVYYRLIADRLSR